MLKFVTKSLVFVFAATLSVTPMVHAQSNDASELTASELENLFSKQKTRGLVLAPTNAEDNTQTQEDSIVEPAETTYVEFAPEEQVNIQISFDFDSAALRSDQKPKLSTLCQVMQNIDVELFRIIGHTDASGSNSYNQQLSLLRAQEVKRFMVSDCGIQADRLEAVGMGEAFPLDRDDPNADANRRVEFQALS